MAHVVPGHFGPDRFFHGGRWRGVGGTVTHYDVFALMAALLVVIALMVLEGR